jgi:tRNA-specific adenosine deaminase 3
MPSGGIASEPVVEPTLSEWDSDKDDVWKVDKPEDRMYYGLHWRKELNWRALGFEFLEGEAYEEDSEIDWGDSKVSDGNDKAEDKGDAAVDTWGDDGEDKDRSFHA